MSRLLLAPCMERGRCHHLQLCCSAALPTGGSLASPKQTAPAQGRCRAGSEQIDQQSFTSKGSSSVGFIRGIRFYQLGAWGFSHWTCLKTKLLYIPKSGKYYCLFCNAKKGNKQNVVECYRAGAKEESCHYCRKILLHYEKNTVVHSS